MKDACQRTILGTGRVRRLGDIATDIWDDARCAQT